MNRTPESSRLPLQAGRAIVASLAARSGPGAFFAAAAIVAGVAQASAAPAISAPADALEPAFPEYATVEELLRLDAQAALQAARRGVANPLEIPRAPGAVRQGNVLLAIFGSDRVLNAEVRIGARVYTYRSARRHAISGGASPYLLDRIDPPCVHLSRGQQKETLCLSHAQH